MTLTQIKYFVETAKCLNFTQAAKNLYVSQQVISKQIQSLENEINVRLFDREKKTVRLTKGGEILFSVWMPFLKDLEESIARAEKVSSLKKRKIRIGIIELSPLIDTLIPLLAQNRTSLLDAEYDFETGTFYQMKERLDIGRIDMLITLSTELPPLVGEMNREVLAHPELGIVLSKNHPLAQKDNLNVIDIKDETFYILENSYSSDAEEEIISFCKRAGFVPENIKYFKSIESMEIALNMGKGTTIAFDVFFRNTGGNLKFYPLNDQRKNETPDVVIAWKDNSFIQYARELKAILPIGNYSSF